MVRKQYRVNTSIDSEDDLDSTFSSSIPTPVNTNIECEGGFMAPIAVDNDEEDKPFFTRKRSSLSSTESNNNDDANLNPSTTMPDYESMSLDGLKVIERSCPRSAKIFYHRTKLQSSASNLVQRCSWLVNYSNFGNCEQQTVRTCLSC